MNPPKSCKYIIIVVATALPFVPIRAEDVRYASAFRMGSATGSDIADAIEIDATDNVYVAGRFQGTVDFDPDPESSFELSPSAYWGFLAKYTAVGESAWVNTLQGNTIQAARDIALDSDGNVYVTGNYESPTNFWGCTAELPSTSGMFISKLTSEGTCIWTKLLGEGGVSVHGGAVTVDSNDNVIIVGRYHQAGNFTLDFDPGEGVFELVIDENVNHNFTLKLDTDGDFVWAQATETGIYYPENYGVIADASDNVYVTSIFKGTRDLDPGSGVQEFTGDGSGSFYLQKLSSDGALIWLIADSERTYPYAIKIDSDSNVYLAGYFGDLPILKFTSNGVGAWGPNVAAFGDRTRDIAVKDGYVYGVGDFQLTVDFDPDPNSEFYLTSSSARDTCLIKLDESGSFVWAKSFDDESSSHHGHGVAVDSLANVYTTGYFTLTCDFDPGEDEQVLTSQGQGDIFVSKLEVIPVSYYIDIALPTFYSIDISGDAVIARWEWEAAGLDGDRYSDLYQLYGTLSL